MGRLRSLQLVPLGFSPAFGTPLRSTAAAPATHSASCGHACAAAWCGAGCGTGAGNATTPPSLVSVRPLTARVSSEVFVYWPGVAEPQPLTDDAGDVDVLFFGTLSRYRKAVLDTLRPRLGNVKRPRDPGDWVVLQPIASRCLTQATCPSLWSTVGCGVRTWTLCWTGGCCVGVGWGEVCAGQP